MKNKKYVAAQWRLPKVLCTWACRCGAKYSIRANDPDLHLLPARIKCWSVRRCRYYLVRNDKLKPGAVVRALDVHRVMVGLGSEQERKCGPAELRKLLGRKLVGISIDGTVGDDRSIISGFSLEGGITVCLAPSTKGVTVYKVIRG